MARILGLILVTLLAAAIGGLAGRQVYQMASDAAEHERKAEPTLPPAKATATNVRGLKPMVTNLASPGVWVRLEAAIVTDGAIAAADLDQLAGEITTDSLSYLRTLSVADIAGAEGLRNLRDDLGERAAVRSGRRVREFIVETLVVQ